IRCEGGLGDAEVDYLDGAGKRAHHVGRGEIAVYKSPSAKLVKVVEGAGNLGDDVGDKRHGQMLICSRHPRKKVFNGHSTNKFLHQESLVFTMNPGESSRYRGMVEFHRQESFPTEALPILLDLVRREMCTRIAKAFNHAEPLATILGAGQSKVDAAHPAVAEVGNQYVRAENARKGVLARNCGGHGVVGCACCEFDWGAGRRAGVGQKAAWLSAMRKTRNTSVAMVAPNAAPQTKVIKVDISLVRWRGECRAEGTLYSGGPGELGGVGEGGGEGRGGGSAKTVDRTGGGGSGMGAITRGLSCSTIPLR